MRRTLAVVCVLTLSGLCRADAGEMATPDPQANKPRPKAVPLLVNDDDTAGKARAFAFAIVFKANPLKVTRQLNRHRPANVPSSRYIETHFRANGANVDWIRWSTVGNDAVVDW